MFENCKSFNKDLNSWDTSSVENMESMFENCKSFNKDLSDWDVSSVRKFNFMFYNCQDFNGDISSWNTSWAKGMSGMFYNCPNFGNDLSSWNVREVRNMHSMFGNCDSFNCDLSLWDMYHVRDMGFMFAGCNSFNSDISSWNIKSVEDITGMFYYASSFDCGGIRSSQWNWNKNSITHFKLMLEGTPMEENSPSWYISLTPEVLGIVFRDNAEVRSNPSSSGRVIEILDCGEPITIYETRGSGEYSRGVWDSWYKISNEEKWINRNYASQLPFYLSQNNPLTCVVSMEEDHNYLSVTPGSFWTGAYEEHEFFNYDKFLIEKNILLNNPEICLTDLCLNPIAGCEEPYAIPIGSLCDYEVTEESADPNVTTYTHRKRAVYSVTIDRTQNSELNLKYGIKVGDTLHILKKKIGVNSLPASFSISSDRKGAFEIELILEGTNSLEGIKWIYHEECKGWDDSNEL
jgi:surface protein